MVPIGVRQESRRSCYVPNVPLWIQGTSFLRVRQVIGIACLFLVAYLRSPEQASLLTFADLVPIDKFYDGVLSKGIHQNGTLILSKWNTHQNGILIKMEHSSKMEHSYYQNGTLIKMEYSLKRNTHIIKKEPIK